MSLLAYATTYRPSLSYNIDHHSSPLRPRQLLLKQLQYHDGEHLAAACSKTHIRDASAGWVDLDFAFASTTSNVSRGAIPYAFLMQWSSVHDTQQQQRTKRTCYPSTPYAVPMPKPQVSEHLQHAQATPKQPAHNPSPTTRVKPSLASDWHPTLNSSSTISGTASKNHYRQQPHSSAKPKHITTRRHALGKQTHHVRLSQHNVRRHQSKSSPDPAPTPAVTTGA
jgi:hypothetical protein